MGLLTFYPFAFAALVVFIRRHVVGFSATRWLDCAVGALVAAALGGSVVVSQLDGRHDAVVVGHLLFFLGELGFVGFLVAAYALSGWRDGAT